MERKAAKGELIRKLKISTLLCSSPIKRVAKENENKRENVFLFNCSMAFHCSSEFSSFHPFQLIATDAMSCNNDKLHAMKPSDDQTVHV
jgi:hypothetical protein